MTILQRILPALWLVAALAPPAQAGEASPWVQGHHSRVRLVAGGAEGGARLAGIEIALDPGFKTYWRTPGESGLPPAFDWAGSGNLSKTEVLWPAPQRVEDAGGIAYVYKDRLLLPVRALPQDPGKPVRLALKLDYGVCKDICIPAQANLVLDLVGGETSHRPAVEAALAQVPKPQVLGAPGDLSVLALKPAATINGKPALAVSVRAPAGADLFVEGPDNWYLGAGPMQAGPDAGSGRFLVDIFERPKDAAGRLDLRFTLVAGGRAVETAASLDTASLPR
ncbi:MAG TPA: protein-disulfide reductase DsbD domain-containing protein [Beijerinckiaceae bacterium]|jgi:DsbC/DsbD-like thiol-disulfide interchange protein